MQGFGGDRVQMVWKKPSSKKIIDCGASRAQFLDYDYLKPETINKWNGNYMPS
jgi:hypothetical protein